jgi:CHAT domain-containing protein/tetratricopeptide (TPR) repeat protein
MRHQRPATGSIRFPRSKSGASYGKWVDDLDASLRATQDRQTAADLMTGAGGRARDTARAVALAEQAVAVHRKTGPPEECAESWYVLGTAWWSYQDGDVEENLDKALDAMMFALELRGETGPPRLWARVIGNMGAIYWQRSTGNRAGDTERAISAWHAAAEVFVADASPEEAEEWVAVQGNLVRGYCARAVGEREDNVGKAIAIVDTVAAFHQRRGDDDGWARTRNWLGKVLLEHLPDAAGTHVERAIGVLTELVTVPGLSAAVLASTESNLAIAYTNRVQGDRAHNIATAMAHCLSVLAKSRDDVAAAQAHNTLGAALLESEKWAPPDIEAAIGHLTAAVELFGRHGPQREYAKAQFNLGQALQRRPAGDPGDNLERALTAWTEAERVYTHAFIEDHAPGGFLAVTSNAIGVAYLQRRKGDRGDNLEHAITAFQRAILRGSELRGSDIGAGEADAARHNLGSAFLERRIGDPVQNLVQAREALEDAARVRTRERSALDWALTQNTVGVVYAKLAKHTGQEHLTELAVAAHQNALQILDPVQHTSEWQRAQCNLAAAYLQRRGVDRSGDEERAIAAFKAVLATNPQRDDAAIDWFVAFHGLGMAYMQRDAGRLGEDAERAAETLRACLDRLDGTGLTDLRRTTATSLGKLRCSLGRWADAAAAYGAALGATDELYGSMFLADSRNRELEASGDTFALAAYAMTRADPGSAAAALQVLERGRARNLVEQLSWNAFGRAAESGDPELRRSYLETLAAVREIEAVLQDGSALSWLTTHVTGMWLNLADNANSRRVAERLLAKMVSEDRDRLAAMAVGLGDAASYLKRPTVQDLAPAATATVPVAYLVCTPHGSVVLVLSRAASAPEVVALPADDFTEADLNEVLGLSRAAEAPGRPGYLLGQLGSERPLKPHVRVLLAGLGERLLWPLAKWLACNKATGVVLVPTGRLGLLPLHATPVGGGPAGRCLLDDFDVSYAPSAGALRSAREAATAARFTQHRLVGVADTTPDRPLQWAGAELAEVATHFTKPDVWFGAAATRTALTNAAEGATYVHLACHGRYDMTSPSSSGLSLADGTLSISDVLRDRPFAGARLVVASACQTAVTEFMHLPDEVSGLPTAFLAAGTPAVIGTLWPADDLSTALLVIRFYRLHLRPDAGSDPLPPAAALRGAQRWLRGLTGDRLAAELRASPRLLAVSGALDALAVAEEAPDAHVYEHPSYWAPFVLIGV